MAAMVCVSGVLLSCRNLLQTSYLGHVPCGDACTMVMADADDVSSASDADCLL